MQKSFAMKSADLKQLWQNYTSNKRMSFKSTKAFFSLSDLEAFIQAAKKTHGEKFDGVQVYFVRYPQPTGKAHHKGYALSYSAKNKLSEQASLVFVAAQIASGSPDWNIQNLQDGSEEVQTFFVCNPNIDNNTGICPPACGGGKDMTTWD
jgi:hypothetical protein